MVQHPVKADSLRCPRKKAHVSNVVTQILDLFIQVRCTLYQRAPTKRDRIPIEFH